MIQFVIIFLVAAVTISGVAVAWPKFSSEPRPAPLVKVNDIVKGTPVGKNIASVMGISNETTAEPINVASVATSLKEKLVKAVGEKAQHIVVTQAVRQLASQFDTLPDGDKKQIQELICKPSTASASSE